MSKFETRFEAGDDAEKIRVAFYGFLERFVGDESIEGDAHISTEFDRQGHRVCVRLWSAQAMDAFLASLTDDGDLTQRVCRG
jgi:hypothetical protein